MTQHMAIDNSPFVSEGSSSSSSPPNRLLILLVPETNPLAWTVINSILLMWCCFRIYEIVHESESVNERPHGEQNYIIWNFVTTTIWCVEIGLIVWYHGKASTWEQRIELVLAIYFLWYSINLF